MVFFDMAHLSGRLTKKLVENLGPGRHGDGNGLYLVVDLSGPQRWMVRVVVKGQKNRQGARLRTDPGLGSAEFVSLPQGRERALEYRRMAKQGLSPRLNARQEIPAFRKWRSRSIETASRRGKYQARPAVDKHPAGLCLPKIGRMPIDAIGRPDVLMCLSRTFIARMDAFKKYRAKAQQTIRVERVAVNEGGQAIGGTVARGMPS